MKTPGDVNKFLSEYPASFMFASDLSKQCDEGLGVPAIPPPHLIGRKGVMRHIHLGFRAGETQVLRDKVRQLLADPAL